LQEIHKSDLIVSIHCYGAYDWKNRTYEEMVGYDRYLSAIANHLFLRQAEATTIRIKLYGGLATANGLSEAKSTQYYFSEFVEMRGLEFDFELCEEPETSIGICRAFAKTVLDSVAAGQTSCCYELYDDTVRRAIDLETLRFYLSEPTTYLNPAGLLISFERQDPHPHSTQAYQAQQLRRLKEIGPEALEREILANRHQDS
jgi:hypothetical protein